MTAAASPPPPHDATRITAELAGYPIQWRRYRRTLRFAAWLFVRVGLWELVLRRLAGEAFVRRGRSRRLRRWAREFRGMATSMGGVMIKLGQFISSRVDVLPPEVIQELASLQDEVPTVPFSVIRETLVEELGPPEDHFASFDEEPVAAASLGQAHRARLPDGERVIVKIQRPGIRSLVYTDLRALAVVARWLMKWRFIARRANIPALLDEFSAVLWEELDYTQEAQHVEQFHALFEANQGIYTPGLVPDRCTPRVLTLEDVTAIKITDYKAIEAAGIARQDVARRLINTYLWMVFVKRFFHADPHPGNLFVYPLPEDAPARAGQHASGQPLLGRPFYLVFVDFGMVGHLTPEIADGLSETLFALTTRDAHRLIQSYNRLGLLLPGADLDRLEEATRAAFDRVWGMNMSEISRMQLSEAAELGREFKDLLFDMPFQVPQDFLYLGRTVGILIGMCTGLAPDYDPWREVHPFIAALLGEDDALSGINLFALTPRDLLRPAMLRALLSADGMETLGGVAFDMTRRLIQLPTLADDVLRRADRGDLKVQVDLTPDTAAHVERIERAAQRLVSALLFTGLTIGSAILYTSGEHTISVVGFALAGFTFVRVMLAGNGR